MIDNVNSLETNSWGLKVTDRGLSAYENLAHFHHREIPLDGIVLNLGSGLSQTFEKQLKEVRPDLKIYSVDPSLVMENYGKVDAKGVTIAPMTLLKKEGGLPDNQHEFEAFEPKLPVIDKERIGNLANQERTLAAIGQKLPFTDNSIDLALDVHGPAQYASNEEIYKKYLIEVARVLKPGGKFHIFNTYFGDPDLGNADSENELIEMQKRIIAGLGLKAEIFLQCERVTTDNSGKPVEDKRVGAIVTKNIA